MKEVKGDSFVDQKGIQRLHEVHGSVQVGGIIYDDLELALKAAKAEAVIFDKQRRNARNAVHPRCIYGFAPGWM